jgi:hypothetical protein
MSRAMNPKIKRRQFAFALIAADRGYCVRQTLHSAPITRSNDRGVGWC